MVQEMLPKPEKLADVSPGMGLWNIHIDLLVERDVNARVMSPDKFQRLVENMKSADGLESFPLVSMSEKFPGTFDIISGHHRTRAARAASLMVIPVILIERVLTADEITSKQLAHNALAGYDDLDVLRRLYDSIEDPLQRLSSGLTDMEVRVDLPAIASAGLSFEYGFEPIYILFMQEGLQRFEQMLERLEPDARIYAANYADWTRFVEDSRKVSRLANVRNVGAIIAALLDYAEKGMAAEKAVDA